MSYEITIKKPEKLDSKFSSIYSNENDLEKEISETQNEIICYCLKGHDSYEKKKISFYVEFLARLYEDLEKLYINEEFEKDGEITFCGWEYSRECDFERDEIIKSATKTLSILAFSVETPDYFNNGELFYQKISDIEDAFDMIRNVYSVIRHDLIDMYFDREKEEEELRKDILGEEEN